MSTFKNIELRLYLIGDNTVGKRSFAKKFKKLNSTETMTGRKVPTTISDELLKRLKKKEEHRYRSNDEIKEVELLRLKQQEATNFTKIFTIGNVSLECRLLIPTLPIPISHTDAKEIVEELDELERTYRLKFEFMKNEISSYLKMENYNYFKSKSMKTINIFLFMYDLTNKETLSKTIIYFEELKKTFGLTDDPIYTAFVGNKIDIRFVHLEDVRTGVANSNKFSDVEGEDDFSMEKMIKSILSKNPKLNHYEISCKVFFSFEKFFEKFFIENLLNSDPAFSSDIFVEKLGDLLYLKGTFSKADRSISMAQKSITPGPQFYDTDLFYIADSKKRKEAFRGEKKHSLKIFVNKTGPVFGSHKSEVVKKPMENEENKKEDIEEKKKREKLIEELNMKKYGFTMGMSPGKLDLFSRRKDMKKVVSDKFNRYLSLENITRNIKSDRKLRIGSPQRAEYTSPSRERFISNKDRIDQENSDKQKDIINHIENKWSKIQRLKNSKEDYSSLIEIERMQKREQMKQLVEENLKRVSLEKDEKNKEIITELPAIKSSIDTNRGFTIVGKPKDLLPKSNFNHNFYTIKSEFDNLIEKTLGKQVAR